jgi:hypothetical protein
MAILLPHGSARCLCRACGETFSTVRGFEAHRYQGTCLSPRDAGLAQGKGGVWKRAEICTPETLVRIRGAEVRPQA